VAKQHAPWALIGILVASFGIWRWAGLIIAAAVLAAGYFASIRLHPRIACRTCKGAGRFHGHIYTWVYRLCHDCLGSGRTVRYGASRWGSTRMRSEAQATRQAVQSAQRSRWVE
jgi:hypothetical protein